jgi:fermentation-respiration switch protein FrsA (DUF1100 family)
MTFSTGKIVYNRRRVLNMIFSFLFVYATLLLFVFFNQRGFIYYPGKELMTLAEAGVPEMQVITVLPEGMTESIQGWYGRPSDPSKPVLLYFHGNGGGIDIRTGRIKPLLEQGYGVLLAEYRGYGGNPGKPTEKGLYADAEAYFKWLTTQELINEDRVVVYGESLGTGVATYLASKHWNIRGVILDAPFTSLTDVAQGTIMGIFPLPVIMTDQYASIKRIQSVNSPLLVLHGTRDRVVPVRLGKKLFAAANEPKEFKLFPTGGHSDLYEFGAGEAVVEFLKKSPQ